MRSPSLLFSAAVIVTCWLKHVRCAVRVHIAGKVMASRKVYHAMSILKELCGLLEAKNIILEETDLEESQCIIGAYRVKGRLVCEDALKVFGACHKPQSNSSLYCSGQNCCTCTLQK